jgi:hypothetical protein
LHRIEAFACGWSGVITTAIPVSVEVACKYCFYQYTSLTSVTFESNSKLQRIERSAFQQSCSKVDCCNSTSRSDYTYLHRRFDSVASRCSMKYDILESRKCCEKNIVVICWDVQHQNSSLWQITENMKYSSSITIESESRLVHESTHLNQS